MKEQLQQLQWMGLIQAAECANANWDPDATLILHFQHLVELYKA